MKELPILCVSIFVIIFGILNFKTDNKSIILIIVYFIMLFINNMMLQNRYIKKLLQKYENSKRSYEYVPLIISILILVATFILKYIFPQTIGSEGPPTNDFIFILLGFCVSYYILFMMLRTIREKGEKKMQQTGDAGVTDTKFEEKKQVQ